MTICGQVSYVVVVENSGLILSIISDLVPIFVNQYLTKELLDTHATYRVRIWNMACYDNLSAVLSEVN